MHAKMVWRSRSYILWKTIPTHAIMERFKDSGPEDSTSGRAQELAELFYASVP